MIFLSNNAYSTDVQAADVIRHLSFGNEVEQSQYRDFVFEFPEYVLLVWSGSHVDTEASKVDADYMSWVTDWIEWNTSVMWIDGEPVILEESDHQGDDDPEDY